MDRTIRTRETLLAAALLLTGVGQAVMAQGDDETSPGAQPLAILGLYSMDGGLADIASVHFGNGVPGADVLDLEKLATMPAVPLYIATERGDGAQLELNAFGPITSSVAIPLRMHAEVPGTYHLTVASLGTLRGLGCFLLEEVSSGTMTPLWQGDTIQVELHANTGMGAGHVLHAHRPMEFSYTDAPCNDGRDGTATVLGAGAGPFDVVWVDYENVVRQQFLNRTGPVTAWELPAGIWRVIVSGNEVCGTRVHKFVIGVPPMLDATAETSQATCPSSPDGSIRVTPMGGTPPYAYYWSNGVYTDEPELVGVVPGVYGVRVVDANDCERNLSHLVVHGPAPIPGELIAPATAQPGQSVPFASTAAADVQRFWDFGDGTTSNAQAPMHAFATMGTYTVTLALSEAGVIGCQTILTATVVVQAATGIQDVAASEEVRAFTANGNLVLLNPTGEALDVRVFDAKGRTVGTPHRTAAHTPRLEIPTNGWPAGVYVLRAQSQWEQWSFSLVVTE